MQARIRATYKAQPPKVMVLAADTDADWIGASIMKAMRHKTPDIGFCGTGGKLMALQGLHEACSLYAAHVSAFNVWQTRHVAKQIIRQSLIERPDILVIVNASLWALSVARLLKRRGNIKIYFFDAAGPHIARSSLIKLADHTFKTLPEAGMPDSQSFVGHPVFEKFAEYIPTGEAKPLTKTGRIALMPSVFKTFKHMQHLSQVVEALREDYPRLEVVIPIEDGHNPRSFEPFAYLSATYVRGPEKYAALASCDAALASKDASNLDLVALGVPMVLLPKFGDKLDDVFKKVVTPQGLSPLMAFVEEQNIPEHVFSKAPIAELLEKVQPLLKNSPERKAQLKNLSKLRKSLTAKNKAATATASSLILE